MGEAVQDRDVTRQNDTDSAGKNTAVRTQGKGVWCTRRLSSTMEDKGVMKDRVWLNMESKLEE